MKVMTVMSVMAVMRTVVGWVDQGIQAVLLGLVRAYRLVLSPWLGSSCRFEPSCSRYALDALTRHGGMTGARLAAGRLLRCHPWCAGGHDPVPHEPPRLFTDLLRKTSK